MIRKPAVHVFAFLLQSEVGLAVDPSSQVVSILDGNTIEVLHNQRPERIRLHGIDCPEKGQAYRNKAKQATSALVLASSDKGYPLNFEVDVRRR